MKQVKQAVLQFVNNPAFYNAGSVSDKYKVHLTIIKMLLFLFVFLRILSYFVGDVTALQAHYVEVYASGKPVPSVNLTAEQDEEKIKHFAAKVTRQTFNLDSAGDYKSYRNTINYVNSRFFRLTWDSLNLSQQEYESGVVSDGQFSYYLVGQELTAMFVRSGILGMLMKRKLKFWVDVTPDDLTITDTGMCNPDYCYDDARVWNITGQLRLNMLDLDSPNKISYIPLTIHLRVIATSRMISPEDGLMIERIATILGDK